MSSSPPALATLNVTARCNSRCSYCVYSAGRPLAFPDADTSELVHVIDELAAIGVTHLTLSGGEPTLREDLHDLVSAAHAAGLAVTVITNGTRTTTSRVTELLRAGLSTLVVSCDSLDDLTYTELRGIPISGVSRTLRVFRQMRGAGDPTPRLVVSTVVSRANVDSLLPLASELGDVLLPTDGWAVQGYQPPSGVGWPEDPLCFGPDDAGHLWETLLGLWQVRNARRLPLTATQAALERMFRHLTTGELGEAYTCRTGFQSMFIGGNLDCQPCWHLPAVGNLREASVAKIWASNAYDRARARMKRLDCRRCSLVCHDPDWAKSMAEGTGHA